MKPSGQVSWRRAQVSLASAGLALGCFELALTRLANLSWGRWLTWMLLSLCLAGISGGAVLARRLSSTQRPGALLHLWAGALPLSIALTSALCVWSISGWLTGAFLLPFIAFGGLSTCGWLWAAHERSDAMRRRQYMWELGGLAFGLALIGPTLASQGGARWLLIASLSAALCSAAFATQRQSWLSIAIATVMIVGSCFMPVPMYVSSGPNNQLRRIFKRHKIVRTETRFGSWARTDMLVGSSRAWLFTDGHFVSRTAPYKPGLERFADTRLEQLAAPKRLAWSLLPKSSSALIVGAGAGFDVAVALQQGATSVTAVEINADLIDLVKEAPSRLTADVYKRPQVQVIAHEARSWIEQSDAKWDQIQLALVETGTALSRGHGTAHGRLLTIEAIEQWMAHLSDRGVLCIIQNSQWLHERTLAQVSHALNDAQGRRWVAARWRGGAQSNQPFGYVVLARRHPWTRSELAQLGDKAFELGLQVATTPRIAKDRLATDDRPTLFDPQWTSIAWSLGLLLVVLLSWFILPSRMDRSGVALGVRSLSLGAAGVWSQAVLLERSIQTLGAPDWAFGITVGGLLAGAALGTHVSYLRKRAWLAPVGMAATHLLCPALAQLCASMDIFFSSAVYLLTFACTGSLLAAPWLDLLSVARGRDETVSIVAIESLGALLAGLTVTIAFGSIGITALGAMSVLCWIGGLGWLPAMTRRAG